MKNKRIFVLGGTGLLGHKIYQVLKDEFDVYVTFRNFESKAQELNIFNKEKVIENVNANDITSLGNLINNYKPDYIINCIGIIKQLKESKDPKISIYINSLFPHLLAEAANKNNCKVIHISTDCVFSGKTGNYTEESSSDALDLYGKTKYLGEINNDKNLTLRTSIIGHELFSSVSLVDWFLNTNEKVIKGYSKAFYTGFPTITISKIIKNILIYNPELSGLFNLSSNVISKYDLLKIINRIYNMDKKINPYEDFYCDRSLNSTKIKNLLNLKIDSWENMVEEMHEDYLINQKIYRQKNV